MQCSKLKIRQDMSRGYLGILLLGEGMAHMQNVKLEHAICSKL